MKLTVLGAYGPYPPAGGACSGYLLEEGDTRLMLDFGNGIISRIQKNFTLWELDGIVVSHLHPDHISDLFILRYALDMARERGDVTDSLDIYLPADLGEEYGGLPYKEAYRFHGLKDGESFRAGPFTISCFQTAHPVTTLGYRIEAGGRILVYSGDTEYFSGLNALVKDCNLFLCEANYQDKDMPGGNHLSAGQAGELAGNNGVEKLLLTHLNPESDPEVSLREAKAFFPEARLAAEGETYEV